MYILLGHNTDLLTISYLKYINIEHVNNPSLKRSVYKYIVYYDIISLHYILTILFYVVILVLLPYNSRFLDIDT